MKFPKQLFQRICNNFQNKISETSILVARYSEKGTFIYFLLEWEYGGNNRVHEEKTLT